MEVSGARLKNGGSGGFGRKRKLGKGGCFMREVMGDDRGIRSLSNGRNLAGRKGFWSSKGFPKGAREGQGVWRLFRGRARREKGFQSHRWGLGLPPGVPVMSWSPLYSSWATKKELNSRGGICDYLPYRIAGGFKKPRERGNATLRSCFRVLDTLLDRGLVVK